MHKYILIHTCIVKVRVFVRSNAGSGTIRAMRDGVQIRTVAVTGGKRSRNAKTHSDHWQTAMENGNHTMLQNDRQAIAEYDKPTS